MNRRTAGFVFGGLAVALVLAFVVSRWASSEPDGLERVATDHGLATDAQEHPFAEGALADYQATGVDDPGLATGLSGVIGVVATFGVTAGLVWAARRVA